MLNIRGDYLAAYTWAKPQAASSCPSEGTEQLDVLDTH